MKSTGPTATRQLQKDGQSRVQTLAMRCVRIAAWQMVRCPNDAKGGRYWEESATGVAMKSGERPTSNCPRRIIGTSRSGSALFLVDQPIGSALLRVSLGDAWFSELNVCNTWVEWCSLTKEFEHSWHVMLNLKPPESSCVSCDALWNVKCCMVP